ncbi:MAG: DUF1595 domain-containing protein [bacterium]
MIEAAPPRPRAQGRRLFRRPLTQEEAARYRALAEAAQAEGESPDDVARLVLAALLQSPHFLYRTELGRRDGEVFVLTGYELATALAYLIWGSAPDDALLDAAGLGELDDADGRAASVERLLADPAPRPPSRASSATGWGWSASRRSTGIPRSTRPSPRPCAPPWLRRPTGSSRGCGRPTPPSPSCSPARPPRWMTPWPPTMACRPSGRASSRWSGRRIRQRGC